MAYPSVTYTFSNGTTADATQVNQNYTDIINGLSDGTKELNILNLVAAGKIVVSAGTAAASTIATISAVMTICAAASGGALATSAGVSVLGWTSALITAAKPISITDSTASTTYQTGALIVAGGVGIAGAIYGNSTATFATSVSTPSLINGTSGVRVGPIVTSSTAAHTIYSKQGTLAAYAGAVTFYANDAATNEAQIAIGLDTTGQNAWISPAKTGVGVGVGLRFGSFQTDVGGYTSAGAWTFPINATHTFGNTTTSANTVISVNGSGTVALKLKNAGAGETYISNGTVGKAMQFYGSVSSDSDTKVGTYTSAGAWALGAAATTTVHLITNTATNDYGLYVTNADTGTSSGGLRVRCGGAGAGNIPLKIQRNDATDLFTVYGDKTIQCHGLGAGTVVSSATGVLSISSDSRLKIPVESKLPGLAEVLQLSVEAYQWKSEIARIGDKAAVEIGYFADKVAPIIPAAAPMGHDGYYGLYDRSISAAHTNAIKELAALSDAKDAKIQALQQEINSIKERLAA